MAENKFDKQIREMLAESGATLVRNKKHAIYKLPSGQVVSMSQTPSSWRAGRKRITTLKQAIAREQVSAEQKTRMAATSFPSSAPPPRKRLVIPNRPAGGPAAPVQLPTLAPCEPVLPRGTIYTPFGSLLELRQHLSDMDDFWALTPGGRARVLMKSLPANIRAEVVPMRFCRATAEESERFFSRPKEGDRAEHDALGARLLDRMAYTCGNAYYPGLLVFDKEEGSLLVDVVSLSTLVDVFEDIQVLDVDPHNRGLMFADPVLWTYGCGDEPQETDFIMALTPEFARRHDVHFLGDEGWTNPTTVRHVIQALRERNNPSYVPKPRPFIKEALTPFEAYQKKVMPYFRDHIQMEYKKETNWLVTTIVQDCTDVVRAAEALDWIGRIFSYSFRNNGRFMARVVDEDMLELWVSFLNDEDKAGFIEDVREDGYRDPDDDIRGFHSPQTLDYLPELSSLTNVFNADEDARIQSAAQTEPKLQAMMRDLKRGWKANGNPMTKHY